MRALFPKLTALLLVKLVLIGMVMGGSACSGLPKLRTMPKTAAVKPVWNSRLGPAENVRPRGDSPVALIPSGRDALGVRVALAREARQSLDVQYYIWNGDRSGRYLIAELLKAADRGVRVRLLLDDVNTPGLVNGLVRNVAKGVRAAAAELEDNVALLTPRVLERRNRMVQMMKELRGGRDLLVAALDTHPNVEVRLFNPFASRNLGELLRNLELINDFTRLNRRMHNKVFVADNQSGIVGGRNIADHYFDLDEDHNFRDLDLLVGGPAVREISGNFDLYWNSRWAVPVRAFTWEATAERRLTELRHELQGWLTALTDEEMRRLDHPSVPARALETVLSRRHLAPVSVAADTPDKFSGRGGLLVADALSNLAAQCQKEILIESAYFVPSAQTFGKIEERLASGVRVRALTNSLASNDVLPAHAGYSRHRRNMLKAGVEVHELLTHPEVGLPKPSTRLHTKAVVFDRQRVFVGTFNLDPRSAELNTEIGLVAESAPLAAEIAAFIEDGMRPGQSWRLAVCDPATTPAPCRRGQLVWLGEGSQPPVAHYDEPQAGALSRMISRILAWFPIDPLL